MNKRLILVTGGARAGKSGFALKLAQGLSLPAEPGSTPVLFVATAEAAACGNHHILLPLK